jgi:hypothetical protein
LNIGDSGRRLFRDGARGRSEWRLDEMKRERKGGEREGGGEKKADEDGERSFSRAETEHPRDDDGGDDFSS